MKKRGSTYNLALATLVLILGAGAFGPCPRAEQRVEEKSKTRFDPLGLPQDTVIVTVRNSAAEVKYQQRLKGSPSARQTASSDSAELADSLNHQIYRVQLLTADSYSDARKAQAVAEEIFDQSLSLNYDLPYYKLRVGEFATKAEADAYLLKAKAAGYANAWVVLANVGIKELKPLYDNATPSAKPDTLNGANDQHD